MGDTTKTQVHRVVVLVVDHEGLGADGREVLGPASPPPVSSDVVKNMLNQIEAFSTAMRRTWGEP